MTPRKRAKCRHCSTTKATAKACIQCRLTTSHTNNGVSSSFRAATALFLAVSLIFLPLEALIGSNSYWRALIAFIQPAPRTYRAQKHQRTSAHLNLIFAFYSPFLIYFRIERAQARLHV